MSSPNLEAHIHSLNTKIEGEARKVLDTIEKQHLRPIARQSFVCSVACYDKQGQTGSETQLQQCVRNCQVPYQKAQSVVNQEVTQFQDRLQRSMMSCNDEARDLMTPDMTSNPAQMKKFEDTVSKCFTKNVNQHIGLLEGMRKRIETNLKNV